MIMELVYFRTTCHGATRVPNLETLLVEEVASYFHEPPGGYGLAPPFRRGLIECDAISAPS